jgi:hypothetical protein
VDAGLNMFRPRGPDVHIKRHAELTATAGEHRAGVHTGRGLCAPGLGRLGDQDPRARAPIISAATGPIVSNL